MVFIQLVGGKIKRIKGKLGGDKFGANERGRAEDRRYHRECKLAAVRKSSRREGRCCSEVLEPVFATDAGVSSSGRLPKLRESFVTDDGNTRVTIRYNADGMAVCAFVRPAEY